MRRIAAERLQEFLLKDGTILLNVAAVGSSLNDPEIQWLLSMIYPPQK